MEQGTIKHWNADRGYGFITPERGGADLFVHISELAGSGINLVIGQRVNFEEKVGRRDGKPCAGNVRLI